MTGDDAFAASWCVILLVLAIWKFRKPKESAHA